MKTVAAPRGPKLSEDDHKALVLWACDCAERVLPCFEKACPNDDRPRRAIEVGRAWTRGEIPFREVRAAALVAHAAARDTDRPAVRAAARAAGHAAATAHVHGHARYAADYAATAATNTAGPESASAAAAKERTWQIRRLPEHLRPVAFPTRAAT